MFGDAEADVRWASQLSDAQWRYDNMEPPDEPDLMDIDPEEAWLAIEDALLDYMIDKLCYSSDAAFDALPKALKMALEWREKKA